MQENRSFDHALGTLQGVRGFNDPRALRLANGNPVWLQTNADGRDLRSLPPRHQRHPRHLDELSAAHRARRQVDAWNRGSYDQWLQAKRSHKPEYADMPLTMGHYTREDMPFYYALADAFTVCDQNFSGAMTSTTPNRSIFWTGTVREEQHATPRPTCATTTTSTSAWHWATFPEQLQKNGISWKFYQNEL